MKIQFTSLSSPNTGAAHTWVITVGEKAALGDFAKALDKKTGGALTAALKSNPKFKGNEGQRLLIPSPKNCKASNIVLLGLGKKEKMDAFTAYHLGAHAYVSVSGNGEKAFTLILDQLKAYRLDGEAVAGAAAGIQMKSYSFNKYKTKQKPEQKPTHVTAFLASAASTAAKKAFVRHGAIASGVTLTRDMGNEPPNVMTPIKAAQTVQSLRKARIKVEILDEKRLRSIGMGSLLAVAKGSTQPPRVVIMRYNVGGKSAPIAFVGKGVTFDTGGINLKPFASMWDMKFDMQGASTVVGTMLALAQRKAKVNAIGVVGFVENMPDGSAYRPGDILTSLSGQTIEVQNTDAEGRLVLNDLLWYTQAKFKPTIIIDLATLTGAVVASLGNVNAGLFSNNDTLAKRLHDAGQETGDYVWRLPLDAEYDKQLQSDYADMRNIGSPGEAGAITAAQFLQRFIKDGQAWAHLDIAGTAYTGREYLLGPKGATAFGVRLLDQLVYSHYEKR